MGDTSGVEGVDVKVLGNDALFDRFGRCDRKDSGGGDGEGLHSELVLLNSKYAARIVYVIVSADADVSM